MRRFFALTLLGAFLSAALYGCSPDQSGGSLKVDDVWARTAQAGGTSAVYFVINNQKSQPEMLVDVKTDVAEVAELHKSSMDADGTMKMEHQENVEVPADQEVAFEQGGLHIMLMGLKEDLKEGDTFPVTLVFENSGEIQVEAEVRAP